MISPTPKPSAPRMSNYPSKNIINLLWRDVHNYFMKDMQDNFDLNYVYGFVLHSYVL